MNELTGNRIRTTAGKLGLPHLAETINEYTRRADETKMGYLDFLDLVLSEELAFRDDRRFRQGLRLSKLPHHRALEEYGFSFQPGARPAQGQGPRRPVLRRRQGQRRPARAARSRWVVGRHLCYFTLDSTDHAGHKEQGSMIRRYIVRRNKHAQDERLRAVVSRANVV